MFAPVGFGVSYFAFPILFFLFFILVGATALVTRWRNRQAKEPALPVERLRAVVRQKRMTAGGRRRYQAVFSLETGVEATFWLTRVQYNALVEGVCGALVHKGERFLCFEEQKASTM